MMKNLTLFAITALILIISSCSKTGPQGATGLAGPLATGTLTGYVNTFDQYGFRLNTAQSGVTVHISDSTADSTLTNASGQYTFANLKTGIYNLTYAAPGFAPIAANDYSFLGGGTIYRNQSLSKYPTFSVFNVTSIDTTIATDLGVLIRGNDTADLAARSVIVFGSTSSGVSSAPANYTYVNTGTIKAGLTSWNLFINSQDLHDSGLPSGSTVYFVVYPYSTGAPTYVDQATGKTVYGAVGTPSTVFSVVIP